MWIPVIFCTGLISCLFMSEWKGTPTSTESECRWMAQEIIDFVNVPDLQLKYRCEEKKRDRSSNN